MVKMTKKKISGFAFHCHHDTLFEGVYDYDERVRVIKRNKPQKEQELRLKLFRMIPDNLVPSTLRKAWEAYGKAGEAFDKAWEAFGKEREAYCKAGEAYGKEREAYCKAGEAFDKAGEARDKAWEAYGKAWEAYGKERKACLPEIEKLHKELCPDCPWNGKTIFPEK